MTSEGTAFQSFRGRPQPLSGSRIRVYRNLNRPTLFSVVALTGDYKGKVMGYAPVVGLANVSLKVSEKQRQGVLTKQVRTVHAFAEGDLVELASELPESCNRQPSKVVTYQPYRKAHFFDRDAPDIPIWELAAAWSSGANLIAPQEDIKEPDA